MFDTQQLLTTDVLQADLTTLRSWVTEHYLLDEATCLTHLLALAKKDNDIAHHNAISDETAELIRDIRVTAKGDTLDALLQQYSLDTQEGIILMCLAEALLRIPDSKTADALIKDKLTGADWSEHLNSSESLLVNASTWGLALTGKVIGVDTTLDDAPAPLLARLVNKLGEPVVRKVMYAAMKIMGKQFVLGTTIRTALKTASKDRKQGYWHSFDMLGESALTMDDAKRYLDAYKAATNEVATYRGECDGHSATISIKLSALHPRYEESKADRVLSEMADALISLIEQARELDVGITIDAEEADRLELSLSLFEQLYRHPCNQGWGKLGMVVQTYSKCALPTLLWLNRIAEEGGEEIPVRLVKGAYWDAEIKLCQQGGAPCYPLFTRKASTDVSYLACARFLLSDATQGRLYPQFATHNAHSAVSILHMAGERPFEFQRLHGMGEDLYTQLLVRYPNTRCRIYAPVGEHKDLLPYLVRRLLENGANTSFVHKLLDPSVAPEALSSSPIMALESKASLANDKIPLPPALYPDRLNSQGTNLHIEAFASPFFKQVSQWYSTQWSATSIINGQAIAQGDASPRYAPQNHEKKMGEATLAQPEHVEQAIDAAAAGFKPWRQQPVEQRASLLEKLADELEAHKHEFIALCVQEAGKTLQDGIDEVREAVDFCRYYANQARARFSAPITLPGPTGESNQLYLQGRGVFVCISPWNFPLAIFLGQITAALAAGNSVIAKPAEQTSLIAWRTVSLMLEVGFPPSAIQLLIGKGSMLGPLLCQHAAVAGVAFTGSTDTAKRINQTLAERHGPIATFIAETGGQNAMLVDSTALAEQVVKDAIDSGITSAGQRCSALRVMYIQEEVAPRIIELMKGALAELAVGDPGCYRTDVGPVIDKGAQLALQAHIEAIQLEGTLIAQAPLPDSTTKGSFVAPTVVEINHIAQLKEEHFGPIIHVIRYPSAQIARVVDEINSTGFGLTLGIHSRNEQFAQRIAERVNVGNVYINRNQIGAMVGTQPFGGQGLSGTGPKAGGPHYLLRFATERTVTNNLTAIGGNARLLSLGDA